MALAYFATKLSPNIAKTPEGFLVCRNVRIARTGYQDYLPEEVDFADKDKYTKKGVISLYRSPEEVFSAGTIASAEGKDVTDLHPSQLVNVNNHASYSKGHGQNIRRGEGEDEGYLIADLIVKDACLISKIESGQKQVSCGYSYDFAETEKGLEQTNITINHIAIVPEGRAGKQVAIRDAKPTIKKEITYMDARQKKLSLIGRVIAAFARDASPEEVGEAMQALGGEEPAKPASAANDNEHSDVMQQILTEIKGITARLEKLEQCEAAEPGPEEAIDACIAELEKGKEATDEAGLVEPEVLSGEELPANPIPGADAATAMLKSMKPVIAAIADPAAKKQASDALLASVKGMMGVGGQNGSYADIAKAARQKAVDHAKEQQGKQQAADSGDLGKLIKEQFHRKPQGGKR